MARCFFYVNYSAFCVGMFVHVSQAGKVRTVSERRTSVSPTRATMVGSVKTIIMATPACVPVVLQVKAFNPLAFF